MFLQAGFFGMRMTLIRTIKEILSHNQFHDFCSLIAHQLHKVKP